MLIYYVPKSRGEKIGTYFEPRSSACMYIYIYRDVGKCFVEISDVFIFTECLDVSFVTKQQGKLNNLFLG
jgi:hypothetical protein